MKIVLFTLFFLALILPSGASAAVMPAAEATSTTAGAIDKDAKRNARLERLIERFQYKMEKRLERRKGKSPTPSMWDDSRFRLGIIFILAGIGLAILDAIIGASILSFLAGLAGLAGVILIVWSLIEYYA